MLFHSRVVAMIDECDAIAIASRLARYVDELLEARRHRNPVAIRGRTQLVLTMLEKLRAAHRASPLPADLVSRIRAEKERAQLDLREKSQEYENICWECFANGSRVFLDRRVDSVCRACGWVQCPECGACRDPKHGGCSERSFRGKRYRA